MKLPLSWLKDFVDITLNLEDLAKLLTMAGLEVEGIELVGLPMPPGEKHEFKYSGLSWDPDTIVVAQIDEVMPHPNADRLVLCRLNDGQQEHTVLTGAPNLYPFKGQGPLPEPIKVAYAKEGAKIYDGHQPGQVLTTLKRAKIRGVESYSMVCSEKELGISEEHEGVIFLDPDAPTGMPLVDYMGDAVFEISILPNMIRDANVVGVAREVAALTGKELRTPQPKLASDGPPIGEDVRVEITNPELNPRFVAGLVRGVTPRPSPYWVQRRLRLAGMRPINSVVDATNYVMLELGEPLHAFDYDLLVRRNNGLPPTIITRTAQPGEKIKTLDGVEHTLDDFTELVADTAGALSIAGVMGGAESEVTSETRNVLLEGASWNFINVRRTMSAQRISSEAGYRFARGIHPHIAKEGVQMGVDRIALWSGGEIAYGLIDVYPHPVEDPVVDLTPRDVKRLLGIDLTPQQIADLLKGLEFQTTIEGETVHALTPPIRMDIGEGIIGKADLLEEVARMYGYNNIPATLLSDSLPRQVGNPSLEAEERIRDILSSLELQEVATYRLTSPERERRALPLDVPPEDVPYVRLANPIASDRVVMRRSLLASVLEILERNIRLADRLALYEIGPVFLPRPNEPLPAEQQRLVIAMTGLRHTAAWDRPEPHPFDFFDIKGVVQALLDGLHVEDARYEPVEHPSFHPGKAAALLVNGVSAGVLGELHPQVKENYDFGQYPVLAAELDVNTILAAASLVYDVQPVPVFPPVLEDIAVIVDEDVTAGQVQEAIERAGGDMLVGVRLFDIFRGPQIGEGKKSLAYNLTYQAPDRTLTDEEATRVRNRIIKGLDRDLGAKIRS